MRSVLAATATLTFGFGLYPSSAFADAGPSRAGSNFSQAAASALAQSPTDFQLVGATDEKLVELAVRCVAVEQLSYCLHVGWESAGTSTSAVRERIVAQSATGTPARNSSVDGDDTTMSALRRWAQLPSKARIADEKTELDDAATAAGKVLLLEHVIHGTALPTNFKTAYPNAAPLADRLVASGASGAAGLPIVAPHYAMTCDSGSTQCGYAPMSPSQMAKQNKSYNCGAASMQAIAWNNPKGAVYKTQSAWETILGTTTAGTNVDSLVRVINDYTNWDDSDFAGRYYKISIKSWSVANYRSLFISHFRNLSGPVQLHPVLNRTTSTYYPGTTGGHYDVAYWYDYSVGDYVGLYEPAGGAPQGNIYTSVTATEDTTHIRLAQLANTANQNIVY